jgi:hypothetical protein
MNLNNAVITAMKMFSDGYPGKFTVGNKVGTWERSLVDIDPDVIPVAALHLISTRKDWPPDLATLREQCVLMSTGELQEPTGPEAWEHVMDKVNHKDIELTDFEKTALKQIGKTIRDIGQTSISNLSSDRSRYIEAFNHLVAKRKLDRQTLPEVKALVESRRPELPPHTPPVPLLAEKPEYHTPEEVSALVAGVVGSKEL